VLTVAIPTLGRPSLARCVFSFIDQLQPGDRVLLVADPKGDTDYVRWVYNIATNKMGVDWRYTIKGGQGGWGQDQRNHAYDLTDEGHIWCLSDDDIATPGALEVIRRRIEIRQPDDWFLFQVGRTRDTPWVWTRQTVEVGNLDADCIVAPATTLTRWGLGYEGDKDFATGLLAERGQPIFVPEVIAVTKPDGDYLDRHYARLALEFNVALLGA